MQKEIIEYEKLRSIDISYEQYTYTESIKTESNGDYTEFFNMGKGQNYTFYYCNAVGNPKDGKFTIEHDSILSSFRKMKIMEWIFLFIYYQI